MTPLRVRVIEDEPDIAVLLQVALEHDAEVEVHATTTAFTDALQPDFWVGFDVGIIDLMLPGVTGLDILHAARAYNPRVRLIVYTALTLMGDQRREVHRLADLVLEKTTDPFDLIAAVKGGRR